MGKLDTIEATAGALRDAVVAQNGTLDAVDLKLDEVKAFIESLDSGADEAQLDRISAILDAASTQVAEGKTKAEAVLAESDALDAASEVVP